ncbi:hypothetical protein E2C01_100941 [Portunus trituberculatus]|uniref:Uncharacterized protein n=1 Tax=Portunus trituberculatus TaxID=210409 RepID=A0A5B7KDG8_PORTR|nr:hypothetical protein [Portunus trituberculatus]
MCAQRVLRGPPSLSHQEGRGVMYLSGRFAHLPFPPSCPMPYLPSLPCLGPLRSRCIHSSSRILQAPSHHLITHPVLSMPLFLTISSSSSFFPHRLGSLTFSSLTTARSLGATPTPLLRCFLPQVLFRLGMFVEVLSQPLIMKTNHVAALRGMIRLLDP